MSKSSSNPFMKTVRESAGIRLAVLFGSFFIFLLLTSVINPFIDNLPLGSTRDKILINSVIQCLLAFCLPAILLSRFSSNNGWKWLELTRPPKIKSIVGVLLIYFLSLPAMEWLIEWNSQLHFPSSLSALENLFRQWENASETTTKILLNSHGWYALIIGVLIIGLLTGFSEELFFRGGLQGIFERSSMGQGASVWLAAIIFSMMHFQFFGFFPRLLMGAFFGYLLIWTRSLWVPVFAHALNNSMVVITSALTGDHTKSIIEGTKITDYFGGTITIIISTFLTILFLYCFKDYFFKSYKSRSQRWQKSQLPPATGR